jgi:hypothetical protein
MALKVVFLFGAGASYGSFGMKNIPPLGIQLFNELVREYPSTWGKLPSNLSGLFKKDVEFGMGKWYEDSKNLAPLLKDMTRYFSKFRIDYPHQNFYWKLFTKYLNELDSNQILLSTINYECLIEYALFLNKRKPGYWESHEGIRLLKLHGSCNFIIPMTKGKMKIKYDKFTNFDFNFDIISPENVNREMDNNGLPAAMSIYAKGKEINIARNYIKKLVDEFQNAVQSAEIIVIIGIKPNSDDTHIWDCIINSNANLYYVGNRKLFDKLVKKNRKDKISKCLSRTFESGFDKICNTLDDYFDINKE